MSKNIPKEHHLFEALREDPYVYVDDEKNDVKIGDTIKYIANNQLGSKKYIVIELLDENGNIEKGLQEIEFYPPTNSNGEPSIFNFHWYPDYGNIGGKKKHKKTQHRRKRKKISKLKKMKSKKYRRHQK